MTKAVFCLLFLNDRIPEHQQHRRASTNTDTECAESSKQVLETDTSTHTFTLDIHLCEDE